MSFLLVPALVNAGYSLAVAQIVAFAVSTLASSIISKAFQSNKQNDVASNSPNPGNRVQLPPATDNKLPVVYGSAWLGGMITDLSITSDNQKLYYVISLCEVTNNGGDQITFGDIYYGGKKVEFQPDGYTVMRLLDESTGEYDENVNGKIQFYLYDNGSFSPANSSSSAIDIMNSGGLVYTWDGSKAMTNCAFAILVLEYNQNANITGLQKTQFQVTNSRYKPGDCISDYLQNTVYGCAIPVSQIDTDSITALNAYCAELFTFNEFSGGFSTQERFRFDGVVDTSQTVLDNLQNMAASCDCLIKYNERTAQWGVIVQSTDYDVAMALDDSNLTGSITITPIDLAGSYNVIECKFPDETNQDAFNAATFDLAQIAPELLFPNEPVNKQTITLGLVNNNVRAQYIANRLLKAAREDLQVQVSVNYVGLQLEAGDIVTITNSNYGWVAKLFRISKCTQEFGDEGSVNVKLSLTEYTPAIFDDVSITQYTPAPNTGIGSPLTFGTIPTPVIVSQYPNAATPSFSVQVTTSTSGIVQYAEVWYSAFSTPTSAQLIFAGTSETQPSGNPYSPSTNLSPIVISDIPAGDWYFFSRMVNSLGTSQFSSASTKLEWRPSTFQYTERYLIVAYADAIDGTGFSLSPTNKEYYGLQNSSAIISDSNPANYKWYLADPNFGTTIYLCYTNRTSRRFSFDTGFAGYAAGTGAFVPTQAALFDPRIWSALPDGINYIDLDKSTGQVLQTGSTSVGTGELEVTNGSDGKVIASLKQFLDFGGPYQKTSSVATLTVDIYGRVVGFEPPDDFYYTSAFFTATASQTVFSVTRASSYISGQCLVFQNGVLLDASEYTDTAGSTGTVTLDTGVAAGTVITIISFRSYNASTGTYASFTRNTATLTNASSYTASGFTLQSGYELLFLNGTVVNELDYNIIDQTIQDFPSTVSGLLTIIQWSPNNLGTPNGNPVNILANTVAGQSTYPFSYDANAFNLYQNGCLLRPSSDYSTATGTYTFGTTPVTSSVLVQQTFARTGAV